MSFPGEFPEATMNRSASAPYWSITTSGSMPFPSDFDILRPFGSRISPWSKTVSNGRSFMNSSPATIILDTQKVMMSQPVTSVDVG